MSLYRYFLDGVLLQDEPQGWDELLTSIVRDDSRNGIVITQDAKLTFRGDGYGILLAKFNGNFCSESSVRIEEFRQDGQWYIIHEGVIFTPSIVVDEKRMLLTATVQDNSFFARINNNKSIGAFAWVGKSKNGLDITPAPYYVIEFFTPATAAPTYIPNTGARSGHGFRVEDLFRFIIQFMSDGQLGFVSDYFSTGDGKGLAVTCGAVIRAAGNAAAYGIGDFDNDFPKIKFQDLFDEVNKKFNVGFVLQGSNIRIEPKSYFDGGLNNFKFENINELSREIAQNKLYSAVELGDKNNQIAQSISFNGDIDFIGWKEEQYFVLGTCNIDRQLNTVSDWAVSSTLIEDALESSTDDQYDKLLVFIDTDLVTQKAKAGNILGTTPPWNYNSFLANNEVVSRYFNGIPNSIATYFSGNAIPMDIGTGNYIFITPFGPEILPFNVETAPHFDPDNVWNSTLYRFTAPVSNAYKFKVTINPNVTFIDILMTVQFRVYDAGSTLKYISSKNVNILANSQDPVSVTSILSIGGTDYMEVWYFNNSVTASVDTLDSWIELQSIVGVGDFVDVIDSDNLSVYRSKFENYPISKCDFANIKLDPTGLYEFSRFNEPKRYGYLESIKYNHKLGIADIQLIQDLRLLRDGNS